MNVTLSCNNLHDLRRNGHFHPKLLSEPHDRGRAFNALSHHKHVLNDAVDAVADVVDAFDVVVDVAVDVAVVVVVDVAVNVVVLVVVVVVVVVVASVVRGDVVGGDGVVCGVD